jgi:receptor protein-tyrosine kinase
VVAGVLAGLAVAALLLQGSTPLYASSARFFVSAADASASADASAAYQGDLLSQQRVASYAVLLTDEALAARVVAEMGLNMTPAELAGKVTAKPVPDTVLLDVTVTDTSPERAHDIADTLSRRFTATVAELETADGASRPTVEVRTVRSPELDPDPVSPNGPRTWALGAVLGLVFGTCLSFLHHRLDKSVRTGEEIRDAAGRWPIGAVPDDPRLGEHPVVTADGRGMASAEAFRAIRTNLQLSDVEHPPQVVVVTSAIRGEGRTTLAVNLAAALGQSGTRVMLIEADVRNPTMARYCGLDDGAGLTEVLTGSASLDEVTQPWGNDKVTVLVAGQIRSDPGGVMGPDPLRTLLCAARETHDVVLIDAPPLLAAPEAALLGALADGCVLASRFGMSRRSELAEAATMLSRLGLVLLGVVLNGVPQARAADGNRRLISGFAAARDSGAGHSAPGWAGVRVRRWSGLRSAGGPQHAARSRGGEPST